MGGSDDPSNLIELTPKEHAKAHLKLYEDYNNKEDLCAYYMLSGQRWSKEFITSYASLGGVASYKKRLDEGTGHLPFFGADLTDAEIFKNASKGGKIQGKRNAENGHLKRIAQLPNKRATGKKWVTTGTKNKMINPKEDIPSGYHYGKTQKKNK